MAVPDGKFDHTVRWDLEDYLRLQEVAQSMGGMSTAALVRWVVLGWLRREKEVAASDASGRGEAP